MLSERSSFAVQISVANNDSATRIPHENAALMSSPTEPELGSSSAKKRLTDAGLKPEIVDRFTDSEAASFSDKLEEGNSAAKKRLTDAGFIKEIVDKFTDSDSVTFFNKLSR